MSAATQDFEHNATTRTSGHRYIFMAKHHGGDPDAGTWLPEISQATEFSIFEAADSWQSSDERGRLYGVLSNGRRGLRMIGTWDEQVAEFQPGSTATQAWHGYPQWALVPVGPPNRRKQICTPDRTVFNRMVDLGVITKLQRKRFLAGRTA